MINLCVCVCVSSGFELVVCVGDASPYELGVTECNEESGVLLLHGVFGCLCV